MIHLDTNFMIALEQPESEASRRMHLWLTQKEVLGVSAIVWTEYSCGPLSPQKLLAADHLLPAKEAYLPEDAVLAAKLFNHGGRRRGSMMDCMIAATALRCGARLATLNPEDFRPFEELGLVLA